MNCDLDDPQLARQFLNDLCIDGQHVQYVKIGDRLIVFTDMTDEEAISIAHQMYEIISNDLVKN